MSEANKALFRRFVEEVINNKIPNLIDELLGDTGETTTPIQMLLQGRKG